MDITYEPIEKAKIPRNVRLSSQTIDTLVAYAKEQNTTSSALIRCAVAGFIANLERQKLQNKQIMEMQDNGD